VNVYKISGWIGIAIAIIAAFANVPYAALIIAVAGVVVGWSVAGEHHVRVIVSALALRALASTFDTLPAAGSYVTAILGNLATLAAGAALLIILRNMYERMKP
jgi:hypothetical protein